MGDWRHGLTHTAGRGRRPAGAEGEMGGDTGKGARHGSTQVLSPGPHSRIGTLCSVPPSILQGAANAVVGMSNDINDSISEIKVRAHPPARAHASRHSPHPVPKHSSAQAPTHPRSSSKDAAATCGILQDGLGSATTQPRTPPI